MMIEEKKDDSGSVSLPFGKQPVVGSTVFNENCMDVMARYPDKFFDLAIVDPYYGIQDKLKRNQYGMLKSISKYNPDTDLKPPPEYWKELFRVSENIIAFGGNYFDLPISSGWIVWDKNNGKSNFADGELAWTSFNKSLRIFKHTWCGGSARNETGKDKVHPFQKPVGLYDWVLKKYAKRGQKILDTHLGSGSSRISCYKNGFEFVGCEIEKEYFDEQEVRFKEFVSQLRIEGW